MQNELTLKDRCDRCSAAAMVRVSIGELPLDFCGHHYRKNEAKLSEIGAKVLVDNTKSQQEKELAAV